MKDEEFKNKINEIIDFIIFAIAFLPCFIWIFTVFIAYMIVFKLSLTIAKNIYNKLIDIFRR